MSIQFKDGAILFVGGQIAMDPACCAGCGPCADCCRCAAGNFKYDATFSGAMSEFDRTYTASSKEAREDGGCKFLFDSGPIAEIVFYPQEGSGCVLWVKARMPSVVGPVTGDTYYVYTQDGTFAGVTCPVGLNSPATPEWIDDVYEWPPPPEAVFFHLLTLDIYCDA
jgi:hypothetical protein